MDVSRVITLTVNDHELEIIMEALKVLSHSLEDGAEADMLYYFIADNISDAPRAR
jgi:hypothetical protein